MKRWQRERGKAEVGLARHVPGNTEGMLAIYLVTVDVTGREKQMALENESRVPGTEEATAQQRSRLLSIHSPGNPGLHKDI